ncbi:MULTISPECIES: MSC_0620 family F1-like ATPase-associated subunit [unclassified Mycoplasma]
MKLKNKLFSLSLISVIPLPSLALISAYNRQDETKELKQDAPQKPADPNKQKPKAPEKPSLALDFDTFAKFTKDNVEKNVEKIIDFTIKYLDNEKGKLLKDLDKDFKPNLEKLIYIQVLQQYLEKNKDALKTKHMNNLGFTIVFPYVMSTNKNYIPSVVEYEGQKFDNIKVGKTKETNYEEQIKPNGKITKDKEQLNTITKQRLDKLIKDYFGALQKQLPNMLFDKVDIPKIGEQINIKFGTFKEKENTINGFSFTQPKDFASWEDYIVSKLHKKFVKFDLDQNKKFILDEQKNKKEDEPIRKPPIIPGDKQQKEIDTQEQIQALPSLIPNVSSIYTSKTANNLKTFFDSSKAEEKEKIFFFDNAINTRFKYSVINLKSEGGNSLSATVRISDRVDPKKSRDYVIKINIDTSPEQESLNYAYEEIIKENKQLFSKIFTALGIDDKINYNDLRNDTLRSVLYNMVGTGVLITNKESYVNAANDIITKAAENLLKNENNKSVIEADIKNSNYLLLTSLFSSTINGVDYFSSLANSLKAVLIQFEEIIKINKDIIKKNFAQNGFDLNLINQYYDLINKQISRLISSTGSRTINIFSWYDNYTKQVKNIIERFDILAALIDNKKPDKKEDKEKFTNSYLKAEIQIKDNNLEGKKALNQAGYAIFAISALLTIIAITFIAIKSKKLGTIKLKKLSISVIGIILFVLVLSIVMSII